MKASISRKLFFTHFLAVILVSGSIGSFFYTSAMESLQNNLQSRLMNSAAFISQVVDAGNLDTIRESADVNLPIYQEYLHLLRALKRSNKDIAFLYLMRKDGDQVRFVIDSDESEDQAMPGRIYPESVPTLMAGFEHPSVDKEIIQDEWGSFLSGYAPLLNGQGRYLVGLDMRADQFHRKFRQLEISGIISLVCSIILAFLFSRYLARNFTSPIAELVERCSALARGNLGQTVDLKTGDELDNLIGAFNSMSERLKLHRDASLEAHQELEKAKAELESRVVERTRELTVLNAQLVAEVAERQKAEKALLLAARTDPLTGLWNRRAIMDLVEHETARQSRGKQPLCFIMGDLDHFKAVNDQYGHLAGDEVLTETAARLAGLVRQQDMASRWGGEEFLLVLPETDLAGGRILAEKLRQGIADQPFRALGHELPLTISLGVSQHHPGQSLDQTLNAADEALYRAKARGRNRVEMAE
ncbi:MAG: diguanylate cyclase [Deltaproteobacteria bacterium]|nr:diguanylate cyclase [Deltaproteobacteria bacterium]